MCPRAAARSAVSSSDTFLALARLENPLAVLFTSFTLYKLSSALQNKILSFVEYAYGADKGYNPLRDDIDRFEQTATIGRVKHVVLEVVLAREE